MTLVSKVMSSNLITDTIFLEDSTSLKMFMSDLQKIKAANDTKLVLVVVVLVEVARSKCHSNLYSLKVVVWFGPYLIHSFLVVYCKMHPPYRIQMSLYVVRFKLVIQNLTVDCLLNMEY